MKQVISYKRKKQVRENVRNLFVTLFLLIISFFVVLPIVLTITNSFMSNSEIFSNYGRIFQTAKEGGKVYISENVNLKFIPDKITLQQYSSFLIKSPNYLYKFWNSVILVVPIVFFQLLIASLAAYSFTRYRGRIREIIFFSYIILMLMPYQITLLPNYLVSEWLHIIDTRWAIWLPGIFSPFAVFLLTKFMRRIPLSYIDAAKIDGAGEWQVFTKICMPLCRSALCSVAILVFIDYWNMVEQPLILLSDEALHPLSIFLSKINEGDVGLAFAAATIYMIPCLLIFLYGEDYLIEGMTFQGGIKG